MSNRKRITWADRQAGEAPALPGYGTEDQSNPAHQAEPNMHEYENGDTSSWAEDVRQPPYPQGNPPAIPGYDVEDKDHPAHQDPPRVSLTAAVRKRASKALKLAGLQLVSKKVTQAQIEDHAMDLMELGDGQLDNMLERFGGGFLADQEEFAPMAADSLDDILAEEFEEEALEEPILASEDVEASAEKTAMDSIMAKLEAMSAEIATLKGEPVVAADDDDDQDEEADKDQDKEAGSQNDPNGPTLSPTPKTEDAARKEAADPILAEFDSYDAGKTGFVGIDEWQGSKAVFAALDTDNDKILARVDLEACGCGDTMAMDDGLEPEEVAMLAEMSIPEEAVSPTADILEDEIIEEPILEDIELMDEPFVEEPMIVAEDDAAMFGMTHDPMGLSDDSASILSSEDDALLTEMFGGKAAKKSDDDEEVVEEEVEGKKKSAKKSDDDEEVVEEEVEGKKKSAKKSDDDEEVVEEVEGKKKAAKTAAQRPQPRKKSAGVKQVGNMTKAAANNEQKELQSLWASDPDVSDVFGQ